MMEEMLIDSLDIWHLNIPLEKPYDLSFGSVYNFDSVYVRVTSGDLTGWGETTPLPGYSDETVEDAWSYVNTIARVISGKSLQEAYALLQTGNAPGFCCAPLKVALEELIWQDKGVQCAEGKTYLVSRKEKKQVPIVGIISSRSISEALEEAQRYALAGFQTLKIKIALPPLNVENDAEFCVKLREAFPELKLRVDANQGYSFDNACSFVKKAQNALLELFEQPFPTDKWKEMQKLYECKGNIPLMLDESIIGLKEIEKVHHLQCADFVKLKLMKQGSMDLLLRMAMKAKEYNIKVIMGNGVQTELGCLQEAKLHFLIDNKLAGEQNGFLKQSFSMLKENIQVENGNICLAEPKVDIERLEAYTERKVKLCM